MSNCCNHYGKKWLKYTLIFMYIVGLSIAIPLIISEYIKNSKNSTEKLSPDQKQRNAIILPWFISSFFVLIAVPVSLLTIISHLTHYTKPYLQKHIIRILWMVPIYSLNAWLALKFQTSSIYLDTLRECYEAYVIYNFMVFLLNYLRHEYPDLCFILEQKDQVRHMLPLRWLPDWPMGKIYIQKCKHGVIQYTVIRPITTAIALICELCGVYGANKFNFKEAYIYLVLLNNISQIWAIYCLVQFYQCVKQELRPIKPISKFLCVKFVVFMSFWQAVALAVIGYCGVFEKFTSFQSLTHAEISAAIQNFLICVEMFFAAVAHDYSFSAREYSNAAVQSKCCASWWAMWDVSDVRHDVVDHIRHFGKSMKKTFTVASPLSRLSSGSAALPTSKLVDQPLLAERSHLMFIGDFEEDEDEDNVEAHKRKQHDVKLTGDDKEDVEAFSSCIRANSKLSASLQSDQIGQSHSSNINIVNDNTKDNHSDVSMSAPSRPPDSSLFTL